MARCRCTNECTCSIKAGANVGITGSGTPSDPLIISAATASFDVIDTTAIDLTINGQGSTTDPFTLRADLVCIDCVSGAPTGYVLTRDANGRYVPGPPSVAPIGAVSVGAGLVGDGSSGLPLKVDLCTYADLKALCQTP